MQSALRRAEVGLVDASTTYRVGGYPRLGLAPLSTELSSRSTSLLTRQVERAEHRRGNVRFRAQGLSHFDPKLANELVSVYLGLAERYTGVVVDLVNFAADVSMLGNSVLACATMAPRQWPTLHALSYELNEYDARDLVGALHAHGHDPRVIAKAESELSEIGRTARKRDVQAHGSIELSACFSHPRCYATLISFWEHRNQIRAAAGKAPALVPTLVSSAAFVLVHEFGHLVEAALLSLGEDQWNYVMSVLEECVFKNEKGRWLVPPRVLAEAGLTRADARLATYPGEFDTRPAGCVPRKTLRKVVGEPVGYLLGNYAPYSRDEIFAESFALALTARDPQLRARLAPFRRALIEVDIAKGHR
jgi:hypothetical protein